MSYQTTGPASPRGLRALAGLVMAASAPHRGLVALQRRYGDLVSFALPRGRMLFAFHPEDVYHIQVTNGRNYRKEYGGGRTRLERILGNGLVTSNGEFWMRQRRLIQPVFHRQRIAGYTQIMASEAERLISAWPLDRAIALDTAMMELALRIAVRTLFADSRVDAVDQLSRHFDTCMSNLGNPITTSLPFIRSLPLPGRIRFDRAAAALETVTDRLIAERMAAPAPGDDVLGMLLAARDDDGQGMSPEQMRDEVLTLLLAGHETTATTLTYALFLLAGDPERRHRLEAEAAAVLGDRAPSLEDLPNLPYTDQVVKETLRLYPPAFIFSRTANDPDELRGVQVEPGAMVTLSPYVTQRDPRWYEAPEQFRPERWTQEMETTLPRGAYFPFALGQRMCIGATFAQMEARLILAAIARRVRLDRADSRPLRIEAAGTLRPVGPILMRAVER